MACGGGHVGVRGGGLGGEGEEISGGERERIKDVWWISRKEGRVHSTVDFHSMVDAWEIYSNTVSAWMGEVPAEGRVLSARAGVCARRCGVMVG